jgi:hypothetical protein
MLSVTERGISSLGGRAMAVGRVRVGLELSSMLE